jgi:hypothetical protein
MRKTTALARELGTSSKHMCTCTRTCPHTPQGERKTDFGISQGLNAKVLRKFRSVSNIQRGLNLRSAPQTQSTTQTTKQIDLVTFQTTWLHIHTCTKLGSQQPHPVQLCSFNPPYRVLLSGNHLHYPPQFAPRLFLVSSLQTYCKINHNGSHETIHDSAANHPLAVAEN